MRSEAFSLAYVDGMIDYLQRKIETNEVTESLLQTMQKWLDTVEDMYRETEAYAGYYSRLLELQTLIYGENNQESKAMEFMKEAVRQAGGVPKLYSHLLRDFIAHRTRQKSEATVAPEPVPVVPVQPEPAEDPAGQQEMPVQDGFGDLAEVVERQPAKYAAEYHNKPRLRKTKVAFASIFALAVMSAAVAHFVPQTSAVSMMIVKHGEISRAKDHYDSLTAQYQACSTKLDGERDSIDTADDAAVNSYNQEMSDCQSILQQQHHAADVYNQLIGKS